MNDDDKRNEISEITELLIRLRPARAQLDSRAVFYEAGYNAARFQSAESMPTSHRRPHFGSLIAAMLIVVAITAAASYHVGQFVAFKSASQDESIAVVVADEDLDEVPTQDMPKNVESPDQGAAPIMDDSAAANRVELFARWMDPLGEIAEYAKRERQAESTLAVFHSTLVSSDQADRSWLDISHSATSTTYRDSFGQASEHTSESQVPLAVGDLQQLALSLESVR